MSEQPMAPEVARELVAYTVRLKRAARLALNLWDAGERAGGEHDLDALAGRFEALRTELER